MDSTNIIPRTKRRAAVNAGLGVKPSGGSSSTGKPVDDDDDEEEAEF